MTLEQEIKFLQSSISNLVYQSGISPISLHLSVQSTESGFNVFSITWDLILTDETITNSERISQDRFEKSLIETILQSGIKPINCSLSICVENLNKLRNLDWKFKVVEEHYLKAHKKFKGVNVNILFVSTIPLLEHLSE